MPTIRLPLSLLVTGALAACAGNEPALTAADYELIDRLGFDRAVMQTAKASGTSFAQLIGVTDEYEPVPAKGLILVTKPSEGHRALKSVRKALEDTGYSAYLNDQAFGDGPDKVAIMKTTDQYVYLAVVRPDGVNYDLDHAQVLTQYRKWADKYGLSLVGAGQDWIEAEFASHPGDWLAFANDVYEFCPDVVDQGASDIATLAAEMRRSNTLYLWWD